MVFVTPRHPRMFFFVKLNIVNEVLVVFLLKKISPDNFNNGN